MCNWFCSGMEDNIVVVTVGCHGSVLFRSVCAAVIIGVAGPDGGPGGCSQNAGAHRVSSMSVFHFSVFSIGSFVVLSVRMAARTPICSVERGVSSCDSMQFWSPHPPQSVYCLHSFTFSPRLLRASGMDVPPVFRRWDR